MHEQNRLALYTPENKEKYKLNQDIHEPEFYTAQNKFFFDDIRSSSIYYVGHSENPIRYFISSKGKFVGQPDYIFTNKYGDNFIVEEKFKHYKSKTSNLHLNHQAQIISYLSGLDTINAKYAYLVNWYYDYEHNYRKIKECHVHKFEKNIVDQSNIRAIYQKILSLNQGNVLFFDTKKLDANKCAKCAVRLFCGHKTGRFTEISVPYSKDYYTLVK